MSVSKNRIQAMQALVAGTRISGHAKYSDVVGEFNSVLRVATVNKKRRRWILQVLHLTRALDTALQAFLDEHGIPAPKRGLGSYLKRLTNHTAATPSRLRPHESARFQRQIVKVRNTYMHVANAYPNSDHQLQTLASEMHACLARVAAL